MTVTTGFEGDAVLMSSPSLTYYAQIEIQWIIFSSVPPRDIGIGGSEDLERDNNTLTHEIMELCTHSEQVFRQQDKVCSEQTKLAGFCTDNKGALNSCLCAVEEIVT